MAKILLGPTVIGIRGTVGGITFSANAGGPYARGWHKPPNPRRGAQLTSQVNLGNWSKAWRALSAANMALWNAYAALAAQTLTDSLAQPYNVSGFNWFVTVNTMRAQMGLAQLSPAPTVAAPVAPTISEYNFRITTNPLESRVRIGAGSPTLALYHQVFLNVVNSIGHNVRPATTFWMLTQVPIANRNIDFGLEQQAKFGTTVVGQRGFAAVHALSTEGRYGPATYVQGDFA